MLKQMRTTCWSRPVAMLGAMLLLIAAAAPALAHDPAPGAIKRTWARTDMPVSTGMADRTWMWGPDALDDPVMEPYAESPGGMREVQYFEKSRMEINNPNAPDDGLWYVTNGLLVIELMTGNMQLGDNTFERHSPANINIAGDPGFAETPTYATFAGLMDAPAYPQGAVITATVDGQGNVGDAPGQSQFNITAAMMAPETGHRTASVFWDFLVSTGTVYESDSYTNGLLFQNPYYATGLPITEAYWSLIMVDGTEKWVLTQAFERRVLTYTPSNNPGFQVEAGNVGWHYWQWRYADMAPPPHGGEIVDQVFYAELTPEAETMDVVSTADGDAVFYINGQGKMEFEVIVVDIQNVTAAHIHIGMPGEDGPVAAMLFMGEFSTGPGGVGTLATGTLTDADIDGMTLADMVAEMEAGNTYVNIHTDQYPGGEIRGQIELISQSMGGSMY